MAKKNWRESAGNASRPNKPAAPSASGKSSPAKSNGYARLRQAIWLLAAAGGLGLLINLFLVILAPDKKTPLIFFPSKTTDTFLSTSAFQTEALASFQNHGNENLGSYETMFETIKVSGEGKSDVNGVQAFGPDENLAMFYVYADRFLDKDNNPTLIKNDCLDVQGNLHLKEFLKSLCHVNLGVEEAHRVVFLDSGRLNLATTAGLVPGAFADAAKATLQSLRDEQVANADRLWLFLSHGNNQFGWDSPELNNSVFGHFVSVGLEGKADLNGDKLVNLDELSRYVSLSVGNWVANYRDSVQLPVLIGNESIALESVKVIHTLKQSEAKAPTLAPSQAGHERFWKKAYDLDAPHSRLMALTRLTRLEQIRYCQSPEYISVLRDTEKFISDAELASEPELYESSLFETLEQNQIKAALSPNSAMDLEAFLNPPPADPPKAPEMGDALKKLSSEQRALLLWDVLQNAETHKAWLNAERALAGIELAGGADASTRKALPVEWQYLLLLKNSVPWQKNDFAMESVASAVRVRELSNRLVRGQLPESSSEQKALVAGFQREWYLIRDQFEQLEATRRSAEDKLIAGQFSIANSEFSALAPEYTALGTRLRFLVECRKFAESSLAISPFLKSYVIRDSINRGTGLGDLEKQKMASVRTAVADLEQSSANLLNALNKSDLRLIEESNSKARIAMTKLQAWLSEVTRGVLDEQTASKYVFEGLLLLESPILEWIEDSTKMTGGLRRDISERVRTGLATQQFNFYSTQVDAQDLTSKSKYVEETQSAIRATLVSWLKDSRLTNTISPEKSFIGSWDQFQDATRKLPNVDQLLDGRTEMAFDDVPAVRSEQLRLELARGEILKSGLLMGFAKESIDMCQQREWLQGYTFAISNMERAYLDLWGNGPVSGTQAVPFADYVTAYQKGAIAFSNRLVEWKLGENKLVPYDSKTLPELANGYLTRAEKMKSSITTLEPTIKLNETAIVDKADVDPRTSNHLTSSLAELDKALTQDGLFSSTNESGSYLTQNRWAVGSSESYGDAPLPLSSLRNRTSVKSTRQFRGHQFLKSITLSPMVIREPTRTVFSLEPDWQKPTTSTVTVVNKDDNTADLYFLLDCSASMITKEELFQLEKGNSVKMTRFNFMKSTLKLTVDDLVQDRRFHMGVAAFSHRGQYLLDKKGFPYDEDSDGNWEISGGSVGVNPFVDCETAFPPDKLTTELDARQIVSWVEGLKALGETPLYYSIKTTLESFRSNRPKILIVLSDGADNQANLVTGFKNVNDDTYVTAPKLAQLLKNKFGNVRVIALQINKDGQTKMPDGIEVATLNSNSQLELKNKILDAVGRNQFSVLPTNEGIEDSEKKRIGERNPISLNVQTPTQFILRTHEVSKDSELPLNLVGGENLRFLNTKDGLEIDHRGSQKAAAGFIEPKLNDVRLADANYEVGVLPSNRNRVVRFGFNNRRELSAIPQRVWAMVTDSTGRSFQLSRPRISFGDLPVVEFELPGTLDAEFVDMKLYVKPSQFGLPEDAVKVEPHAFKSDGEYGGIRYQVKQVAGSDSQFEVRLSSEGSITRPFFLDCPNSRPFGSGNVNTRRTIEFADSNRIAEKYIFDVASGKEAVFELTIENEEAVQASNASVPKETGFGNVVDPIFGDDVVCIRFSKINLRR